MTTKLPLTVNILGKEYAIRDKCDFRVILDCIAALTDAKLSEEWRIKCALFIFYEDFAGIEDWETALSQMYRVIGCGELNENKDDKPPLMNWEHDFDVLAPSVNRVLGYDIRTPDKYTHWYTFVGAYGEIGECTFATIVNIRQKKLKGKKLEKWEIEYMREHRERVELPIKLTAEEEEALNAEW